MRRCCAPQHCCALYRSVQARLRDRLRRRPPESGGRSNFPVASDARLAGDAKQTRFILDLDKPVQFRAFALADPYRVVVDLPQVKFQARREGIGIAGTRTGQGVPLWPGHAGRLADRVRPDRAGQDRQILCARCGQRPAAAAGDRAGSGRPHHFRAVARAPRAAPNCGPRSRTRMPALPPRRQTRPLRPKPRRSAGSRGRWS